MARFGIELEVISKKSEQDIATILNENGIDCYVESYNHTTRGHWKIVYDSSITATSTHQYSFEIVSPPLEGQDGLDEAEKVARILHENGCSANVSCGFHVHVDASDLSKKEVANVVRGWMRNEWIIETLIPHSRRGDSFYCKNLVEDYVDYTRDYEKRQYDEIANREDSMEALIDFVNPVRGNRNDRYTKLNLVAYRRHQTIEFRYHSGTAHPEKVIKQIQFCIAFVEYFSKKRIITVFNHANHNSEYRKPLNKSTNDLLGKLTSMMDASEKSEFKSYWRNRQRTLAA